MAEEKWDWLLEMKQMHDECWRSLLVEESQGRLIRFTTKLKYKELVQWCRDHLKRRKYDWDEATVIIIESNTRKTYSDYKMSYLFSNQDTIAYADLGFGIYMVWFADKDEAMLFKLAN